MSEPSRLDKLHALRDWLAYQLRQTERTIRELEQQTPVSYTVEKQIREGHPLGATVHQADCTMAQRETRAITPDEARLAITKDPLFTACDFCNPGSTLGIDKPAGQ